MVGGTSAYALAAGGGHSVLKLAPEMMVPEAQAECPWTTQANYTSDGTLIIPTFSLFNFFVRAMLQLVVFIISQLPSSMQVRVDSDKFIASFQMGNVELPLYAEHWELAPGWRMANSMPGWVVPMDIDSNIDGFDKDRGTYLVKTDDLREQVWKEIKIRQEFMERTYNLTACAQLERLHKEAKEQGNVGARDDWIARPNDHASRTSRRSFTGKEVKRLIIDGIYSEKKGCGFW